MKIALAQIDARLGDLERICARIGRQASLAAEAGADALCVPAPLLCGPDPGAVASYPNFEHDLVTALGDLARAVEPLGVSILVPATASLEGMALPEVYLLREGRAVPVRLTAIRLREGAPVDPWAPPVFDIAGARVAVTFDAARDLPRLPGGCDLAVYFQIAGFDISDEATAGAPSVADGCFRDEARAAGVWLAAVAPVGGFESAAYTGGSFVLDDDGRLVAAAPSFEEALLVQEVSRGVSAPAADARLAPAYDRFEWLWGALRLHLRDAVSDAGRSRAALLLSGDLPSSLLTLLAVDALGPRNVVGVLSVPDRAETPAGAAAERDRARLARGLAAAIGIRLVEGDDDARARAGRAIGDARARGRLAARAEGLVLELVADGAGALPLSALTKTEAALAPVDACPSGALAPFGDVYLSSLEFLARARAGASSALPAALCGPGAVRDAMGRVVRAAVASLGGDPDAAAGAAELLGSLEPAEVDAALEAHVDRDLPLEEIPLAARSSRAVSLLLMLVSRGEAARRRLPPAPTVSARSFAERGWPASLAWSDLGRRGAEPADAGGLADREARRLAELSEERAGRLRGEMMGILGSLLGLAPEQMERLAGGAGRPAAPEGAGGIERQIAEALGRLSSEDEPEVGAPDGPGPHRFPFFSQN